MRARTLAAGVAAILMTHGAQAGTIAAAPAGLVGDLDLGQVLDIVDQPGARLGLLPTLGADFILAAPAARAEASLPHLKRFASLIQLYTDEASGLRLAAGFRFLSGHSAAGWSPFKATRNGSLVYSPSAINVLSDRRSIARTAPVMTVGWTRALSGMAVLGFDAGAMAEQGIKHVTAAAIAQPRLAMENWSRIAPVARVSLAMRF